MAGHHGAVAAPRHEVRRRRLPVGAAGRRLLGAGVISALVAGLLVGPVLCWGGGASAPVASAPVASAATADRPVPRALREDVGSVRRPPVREVDVAGVLGAVDVAARPVAASVGAVVLDAEGRTVVATPAAERPLPSASLVKLLVVAQLLARGSPDGWDQSALRRMERAITRSDDGAMNALWDLYDGPSLVREAVSRFGLTGTAPPAVPGQWGEATTTASDVARLLSAVAGGPAMAGWATLLGWMRAAEPTAADGFDQTFGLLAGAAAGVAVKQGWMCCVDGRRQLHSAGVLADGRVVVVLADLPVAASWARAATAVDGATAALLAGTG